MKFLLLVVAFMGTAAASGQILRGSDEFREYVDTKNEVSFRYPASWLLNRGGVSYFQPLISLNDEEPGKPFIPTVKVGIEGRGIKFGLFSDSNFINAMFLYRFAPELNEVQCSARANLSLNYAAEDGWKTESLTIDGVHFQHLSGGPTEACNRNTEDLYATFHGGKCFLFEKNIITTCVNQAAHPIDRSDLKQVDTDFDKVIQTVRFAPDSK
jgi:hypothetical protein